MTFCEHGYDNPERCGNCSERMAIVTWLRKQGATFVEAMGVKFDPPIRCFERQYAEHFADAIQAGEHLKP